MIVICLGTSEYPGEEIYIDFSGNIELMKEVSGMSGPGGSILEEGIEKRIVIHVYSIE